MTVRYYSSVASEKTLVGTITSGQTTMVVSNTIGLPSQFPYTLAVDYETVSEELVNVTNAAGTTLTIGRAVDGTSATSHTAGARVRHVTSARDFTDSRNHENASTEVHGLGPGEAIVGTTSTQTLTNKTLVDATGSLKDIEILQTSGDLTLTRSPAGADTALLLETFNGANRQFSIANDGRHNIINTTAQDSQTTTRRLQFTMSDGTTERFYISTGGQATALPRSGTSDSNGGFKVLEPGDSVNRKVIQVRDAADTFDKFVVYASGSTAITGFDINQQTLDVKGAVGQVASYFRVLDSSNAPLVFVGNSGQFTADYRVNISNKFLASEDVLEIFAITPGPQTGDLTRWVNSSGNSCARVRANGEADFVSNVSTSGIGSAAGGWTLSSQIAVIKAGTVTLNLTYTRTGADIVAGADGNIADTNVGTINASYRPHTGFGVTSLTFAGTTGVGTGSVRLFADTGDIQLVTWSSSGTLATGAGLQLTMTYPLVFS